MRLRSESAEPLIFIPVAAEAAGRVEEGVDVEGEPVFFAGEGEVVGAVAHGILLLRLGVLLLSGRAACVGVGEVIGGIGIGVADWRHDGDVAVVRVVVGAGDACEWVLEDVSSVGTILIAVRVVVVVVDQGIIVTVAIEILIDVTSGLLWG